MNNRILCAIPKLVLQTPVSRTFTVSACQFGRRNVKMLRWLNKEEHPYDSRFPVSDEKDFLRKYRHSGKFKKVLLRELEETGFMRPQLPGYRNRKGVFITVPEMIPEFVVPDLTDVELKPYVSYKAHEITQTEFTAKDLFDSVYAKDVVEKFNSDKLDLDKLKPEDILQQKHSEKS